MFDQFDRILALARCGWYCGAPISDPAHFKARFNPGRVGSRRSGRSVKMHPSNASHKQAHAWLGKPHALRYSPREMRQARPRSLVQASSTPGLALWLDRGLLLCFVGAWLLGIARLLSGSRLLPGESWPDAILLASTLLTTVSALSRQLPLENVVMGCGLIAVIGGAAHWASHLSGVPLGPLQLPQASSSPWLHEWMFTLAALWIVIVLNARGLARLLIEPWRRNSNRGLHLLWVTAVLVVMLALVLEPFATMVQRYWLWGTTRLPITWHGAPISALVGWGTVALICSIAATPVLIDKHPHPATPSLHPLLMWVLLNTWPALGCAMHGLWDVTVLAAINCLVPAVLVLRNRLRSSS